MRDNNTAIKKISLLLSLAAIGGSLLMSACFNSNGTKKEEVVTLKWYIPNQDLEDLDRVMEEFNKRLYKKAGFKLKLETIEGDFYHDKMNMNIASEEDFDLWFVGYLNKYEKMAENNTLYDITEWVEKSPLKDTMPQYVWDGATINGSIYAVPNMQVLFEQRCLRIRTDLAEKYNLDTSKITKTEDIEPFLEQIRDNEPDIYPFRINVHEWSFQDIENDFFWDGANSCSLWLDERGELHCVPYYEVDMYKGWIYKLYDWYEKGYIRKDAATTSYNDGKDYENGMYAVASDHYKPGGEYEFSRQYDFKTEEVIVSKPYVGKGSMNTTMIGINKNSKHPEEAFKLIEIINTDKELYNMLVYGLEGVHYEKIGTDRITVKDNNYIIQGWKMGNQFNAYFIDDQSDKDWELTEKLNNEAKVSPFIGFFMDNKNIRSELIRIDKVTEKYKVMLTGAQDPDTYWADFVREMEEAGIDKVCEEVRKQAQEFLNKKS